MVTKVITGHNFGKTTVTILAKDDADLKKKEVDFGFSTGDLSFASEIKEEPAKVDVKTPEISTIPGETKTVDIEKKLSELGD